jgi:hypothetical protein
LKYPKINTLWKRDEKNKFNIVEGDFSCPEFNAIKKWHVTEKIGGTNIRIYFRPAEKTIEFKGRTDEASIPKFLLEALSSIFNIQKLLEVFLKGEEIILYGEGYGNKITSIGEKYREDNSFVLFDVVVDGWWLERKNVEDIAKKLDIDIVPSLGIRTIPEIVSLVKETFPSAISKQTLSAEGIVARSEPLMLFRDGSPIMWKLKSKDYIKLSPKNKEGAFIPPKFS